MLQQKRYTGSLLWNDLHWFALLCFYFSSVWFGTVWFGLIENFNHEKANEVPCWMCCSSKHAPTLDISRACTSRSHLKFTCPEYKLSAKTSKNVYTRIFCFFSIFSEVINSMPGKLQMKLDRAISMFLLISEAVICLCVRVYAAEHTLMLWTFCHSTIYIIIVSNCRCVNNQRGRACLRMRKRFLDERALIAVTYLELRYHCTPPFDGIVMW